MALIGVSYMAPNGAHFLGMVVTTYDISIAKASLTVGVQQFSLNSIH
jgi:hypothetical protein